MLQRFFRGLALCVLLLALTCGALADSVDLDRQNCAITVHLLTSGHEPVAGGVFELYRVGKPVIVDHSLCFELTGDFLSSGISLKNLNSENTVSELLNYVEKKELRGRTATGDAEGAASFEGLSTGLYLVVHRSYQGGNQQYSVTAAFLVSLPQTGEDGAWDYNVDAYPKVEHKPEPTPTPQPTPVPEPVIPQTGMLRWPIPALATGGLVLFSVGWTLYFKRKKKCEK